MLTVAGYLVPTRVKPITKNQPMSTQREGNKEKLESSIGLLVVAAFLAGIIKGQKHVAVLST